MGKFFPKKALDEAFQEIVGNSHLNPTTRAIAKGLDRVGIREPLSKAFIRAKGIGGHLSQFATESHEHAFMKALRKAHPELANDPLAEQFARERFTSRPLLDRILIGRRAKRFLK